MSELESDLYGDLYGNEDGGEYAVETNGDAEETAKDESTASLATSKQTENSVSSAPSSAAKPASTAAAPPPMAGAPIQSYTTPLPSDPKPPYAAGPQSAQSIPTYQQPSDYEAGDLAAQHDGAFGGGERSVRPSEMKDEGKMFIGGLNWDTTDESLRTYFEQFGKVDACTIMRDAAGRSRCFAFLTFDEPASVNAVMVREHFLDGKIIDPKRAIPRQEHQRATKLFIGGLAGTVTSDSMREFFSQFGKVVDSTVMLDRETGRSKGFGFISFEDTNVQPFLGFGNLEIDGKMIDVKLAQPRFQRGEGGEEGGGGGGGGGGGQQGYGGGNNAYGGQQGAYSNSAAGAGAAAGGAGGSAPFDPQALAALYTRMFQMTGGGGMNPMMAGGMGAGMGGMNPGMMGGAGYAGAGMGGGMPGPMGRGMGMGRGNMGGGGGMGAGAGGGAMGRGGAGMNQNIPRGPRGAPTGPAGAGGAGPQRTGSRGQHNYHPYAR